MPSHKSSDYKSEARIQNNTTIYWKLEGVHTSSIPMYAAQHQQPTTNISPFTGLLCGLRQRSLAGGPGMWLMEERTLEPPLDSRVEPRSKMGRRRRRWLRSPAWRPGPLDLSRTRFSATGLSFSGASVWEMQTEHFAPLPALR